MLNPQKITTLLQEQGFTFFAGVPDSLLKELCACITDSLPAERHIITANEGGAVALAAGYYLATGKPAVVYLQNSGLGNTINPLLSLVDPEVYRIPMLIIVGWRGQPGVKDEPQHIKQGRVQPQILDALEYPWEVLSHDPTTAEDQITALLTRITQEETPAVLVVEKDTFSAYPLPQDLPPYELSREAALDCILSHLHETDRVVSTTGKTSREIFELREARGQDHSRDFLTVGSMGHAGMIALGLARFSTQRVFCIDGDGAALMHLGALPIMGHHAPQTLHHIVINNGAHESVGGQPTVAFSLDFPAIAKECGYTWGVQVSSKDEFEAALRALETQSGPTLIEVRVHPGSRDDLGRPTTTPVQNRRAFMADVVEQ